MVLFCRNISPRKSDFRNIFKETKDKKNSSDNEAPWSHKFIKFQLIICSESVALKSCFQLTEWIWWTVATPLFISGKAVSRKLPYSYWIPTIKRYCTALGQRVKSFTIIQKSKKINWKEIVRIQKNIPFRSTPQQMSATCFGSNALKLLSEIKFL